jgi:excisionase family DNA binding protein
MSREATVEEASKLLGVSRDTIMRRIRKGELEAHQEPRPQGHVWRVIIPDEEPDNQHVEALTRELQTMRDVMELLKEELANKNKQIEQLHILLQQAQAALPAPRDHRPWWKFWERYER